MEHPRDFQQANASVGVGCNSLRVRTLELLWHCNEREEEAEQLGLRSTAVEGITSIDYCPSLQRLVTTGGDRCMRMWQLHSRAVDAWLQNSANPMAACSTLVCTMRPAWMPLAARWSPHGAMMASAHCDGKVCLWWRTKPSGDSVQLEEWKDYRHLTGHMSDVYDLCFSPDARYLFSGAVDGSLVIHDLEGSSMPVVQLTDQHHKFCRGVAWDPWNLYLTSCGAGPAMLSFRIVPPLREGGRMHLADQRRCQGDFFSESCALSFRRMSWSPDGLYLAVPYGKVPRKENGRSWRHTGSNIKGEIESKTRTEKAAATLHTAVSGVRESSGEHLLGDDSEDSDDELVHCVNIYARGGSIDKLAARLAVRGYNEIRGVQWAPCVLEPLAPVEPLPLIISPDRALAEGAGTAVAGGSGVSMRLSGETTSAVEALRGSWGPADYRLVLAVWTSDAVLVYTTDCDTRHSDFTDLHMRSITDVAWDSNATHLYTASLDGYISVISFGTSLAVAHRLPTFSARPLTNAICARLQSLADAGRVLEDARQSKADAQNVPTNETAVVVRKKKCIEKPVEDINVDHLVSLLSAM